VERVSRDERLRLAESLLRAYQAFRRAQAAVGADRPSDAARAAYAHTRAALEALEAEAERVGRLPWADDPSRCPGLEIDGLHGNIANVRRALLDFSHQRTESAS
jgi:hypothetical protein